VIGSIDLEVEAAQLYFTGSSWTDPGMAVGESARCGGGVNPDRPAVVHFNASRRSVMNRAIFEHIEVGEEGQMTGTTLTPDLVPGGRRCGQRAESVDIQRRGRHRHQA
jgi:hypothetical protein